MRVRIVANRKYTQIVLTFIRCRNLQACRNLQKTIGVARAFVVNFGPFK